MPGTLSAARAGSCGITPKNSDATPAGWHRVAEKHGAEVLEAGTLEDQDCAGVDINRIAGRIPWPKGPEPGVDRATR